MEEQPAAAPIQDSPQETPTPTHIEQPEERIEEDVQLGEDTQLEEGEGPEGAVIITSHYVARLERESEDANNLIRDLGDSWSGSTRCATSSKRMHVVSASCASGSNRA